MPKLFAEFEINLPGQFIYEFPDAVETIFSIPLGDFEVSIILSMDRGSSNCGGGDPNSIGSFSSIRAVVGREETEFPIPVCPDADGKRDYSIQFEYFWARRGSYAEAACEIVNRLIRYFKFVLGVPHLKELDAGQQDFANATWRNEKGDIVGKGAVVVVFPSVPGMHGQLKSDYLSEERCEELAQFLLKPKEFSVGDQMIDNARSAWFDKHFQRSVLELAIGCEVMVKRQFFTETSPAGAAFDYLEDKARINVKILELIDAVAHAAFGASFKKDKPEDYRNIDHLFRCRNKIAHRGELSFRDDSANLLIPNKEIIGSWFNSVLTLKVWLITLGERREVRGER